MRWWQIKKRHADLERELRSDLELEEEEQRENGVPMDEAGHAALCAFGNVTLIREQTHEPRAGRGSSASGMMFATRSASCEDRRDLHSLQF